MFSRFILSRRQAASLIGFFCSGCLVDSTWAAASEFWNRKKPSEWSQEEIERLTTRSPWARTVHILPSKSYMREHAEPEAPNPGGGGGAPSGRGGQTVTPVPIVGRDQSGDRQPVQMTVRWESAQPIKDAVETPFPADFANRYVIGVVNLQRGDGRATLRAKGKEPLDAGAVHVSRTGEVLFGFSKELLPLGANDKDVEFNLETPDYVINAKFEPKEMIYRGALAL